MINLILVPLLVGLSVLTLMWCSKLQGGAWHWLEERAHYFHDFCKYTAAGICSIIIFNCFIFGWSLPWWWWLASISVGAAGCRFGETFGTGWQSGAVATWDAKYYWEEMEKESFMEYPIFKQIIKLLPRNMFGVFCVIALRGSLWGLPFLFLIPISPEYWKLCYAWIVGLPVAFAIGKAFEVSLSPKHGSWVRKEELRWLITILIAIYL